MEGLLPDEAVYKRNQLKANYDPDMDEAPVCIFSYRFCFVFIKTLYLQIHYHKC